MKFSLQEITLSMNEFGQIIDFGANSILQSPNRLVSTRNYVESNELTRLNHEWQEEHLSKKNILFGLLDKQHQHYWISAALRFIENELFKLPPKIDKSLNHVYGDDKEILGLMLNDLTLPHSYFIYKYKGKIAALAQKYSGYQLGEPINEVRILDWIKQFEVPRRMELALQLLDVIKFIRVHDFHLSCHEFYNSLPVSEKNNLVVFQYGLPTEGSPAREKDFIDALKQCGKGFVIDKDVTSNLKIILTQADYRQKIITIVDDIIGTGKQYTDIFDELFDNTFNQKYVPSENRLRYEEDKKKAREMKWLIVVYSCLQEGKERIEKEVFGKYNLKNASISILSGVITNHCFRDNKKFDGNIIFDKSDDLEEAIKMCSEIGISLYGEANRFGFLDSGQLIVFSHKTPNNTLPIFWEEGIHNARAWKPLFPRSARI